MYKFHQPKSETDIKSNFDCMIRSVSIATNTPYSKVHELMYKHGWRAARRNSKGDYKEQILNTLDELGFKAYKLPFPAQKGLPRMSGKRMALEYNDGTFIMSMAKHVCALIDGTYHDTWDCGNKCVYYALRIIKK